MADDPLNTYFGEIRDLPRLTAEEELDLLPIWRSGGHSEAAVRAGKRLIEGYLNVTALLALHLAPSWMNPLDAVQEANLVLVKLVDDPSVPRPVVALTPALLRRYGKLNPDDFGAVP